MALSVGSPKMLLRPSAGGPHASICTPRSAMRAWSSAIVDAVQKIADAHGVPMAQVALAWVLKNPVVSAPIVGATKTHHLTDAVAALDLTLTDDEIAALEDPYTPRLPTYF